MLHKKTVLYNSFRCAQGACPDTCCGGWNIDIDEDSLDFYLGIRGAFGRKVAQAVDAEHACFRQKNAHCLLQDANGLCQLQLRYGEEALCDTCRTYPRHIEEYKDSLEYSLALSCPEAVRLLLTLDDPLRLIEEDDGEENDWEAEEIEEFDEELFAILNSAEQKGIQIYQDRSLTISDRVRLVQLYFEALEQDPFGSSADEFLSLQKRKFQFHQDSETQKTDRLSDSVQAENYTAFPRLHEYFGIKREMADRLFRCTLIRDSFRLLREQIRTVLYRSGEETFTALYHQYQKALQSNPEAFTLWQKTCEQVLIYCLMLYQKGAVYDGMIAAKCGFGPFFLSILEDLMILDYTKTNCLPGLDTISKNLAALLREIEHDDENLNIVEEYMDKITSEYYRSVL